MKSKLKRDRVNSNTKNGELFTEHLGHSISIKKPTLEAPSHRVYVPNKIQDSASLFRRHNIIDLRSGKNPVEQFTVSDIRNRLMCGDALLAMRLIPDQSVRCIITSPPYWNIVDYGVANQYGQTQYDKYLTQLLQMWIECARVLKPNGKLCINVPLMPVSKAVMKNQHTRHVKNLNNDIEHSILSNISSLQRFSLFIWQKQTTEKMFGSYPYPPNLYEQNTIEFINVLVKEGKPDILSDRVKEASRVTESQWMNLTKQIWRLYPADVKRSRHPAPFPKSLANRLIAMYSFMRVQEEQFAGDIILDPFCGIGTTCVAAKELGRDYVGIDIVPDFCIEAARNLNRHTFTGIIDLAEYGNSNLGKPETQKITNCLSMK